MRAEGKGAPVETAQSHDSRAQGGMGQRGLEEQPGNGLKVLLMQKAVFVQTYTHF